MKNKIINIGIIGFGTIGSSVVRFLLERRLLLRQKTGIDLNLVAVCDKDLSYKRGISVPKNMLTRSADRIIRDPEIDVVIELIGGVHPAKEIVEKSLASGKHVVTANKLLLATHGETIFKKAEEAGRMVLFEASVAGGVPIIKSVREGMIANRFSSIFGILNGTSNYILSQMTNEGSSFKTALKEAQSKGYAERNPSLDIKGLDSAHKLAILLRLCFGKRVTMKDIYVEGIEKISPIDIQYAKELGYVVKLLAIAKRDAKGLEVRVHPTLLPSEYLLSSVSGVYNAIFIDADLIGKQVFYGEGAGKLPTTSAILSDLMDIAYSIYYGNRSTTLIAPKKEALGDIKKMDEVCTRFYLHFSTIDTPGVLAKIADILGRHNISISSVVQKEKRAAHIVPIVILTHEAKELDMQSALSKIDKLSVVKRKSILIRLEK
ncbi:homoserine dehydrogenase [Candidatus Omnitrophota bacterium]